MQEADTQGDDVADMDDRNENHPLVELLGNRSRVKIFMALHDAASPLNPNDIAETAGISRNAWYDNRDVLSQYGVIEQVGEYGNSPVYELTDDELTDALRKVADLAGARRREIDGHNETGTEAASNE